MSRKTLRQQKRRVFDSVFGGANISEPTPVATPATGFTAPGQAFGAPAPIHRDDFSFHSSNYSGSPPSKGASSDVSSHIIQDQVRWDRSWHLVTRTLALPDLPENRGILEPLQPERESLSTEFSHALEDVLYPQAYVPFARQTEDIIAWHTAQARHHFLHQVLPTVLCLQDHDVPETILLKSVKILENAHRQYFHGLSFVKEQIELTSPASAVQMMRKFRRDLDAIISNSVVGPLSRALINVLGRRVYSVLGLARGIHDSLATISPESPDTEKAYRELLGLIESFKRVGLAGEQFQVTFAEIMNDALMDYVDRGCRGVWSFTDPTVPALAVGRNSVLPRTAHNSHASRCVTELCEWIENRYGKLAVQVLHMLDSKFTVSWTDKEKYKEMGIGRLAELRTKELFDVVGSWPHSNGALDDLRTAVTTPQRRLGLTEVFSETLGRKLLHPGTSTLQILQTYICMIWSFHSLDHSKVLLDRVAYPLQMYLCSREDTVRIIITGLLADTEDSEGNAVSPASDKLVELAQLLNNGSDQVGKRANDEDLDWHDMDWIPDPVDAGPGYKRSKSADIIGTLIGVLGSQEVFIKEFQNIIGEHFLRHDGAFDKEVKVLELLKGRFGESSLQACEVMLKDIQDSGRVNSIIRRNKMLAPSEKEFLAARQRSDMLDEHTSPEGLLKPSLHAKILSRLFWPQLQHETYRIPDIILKLQKIYEGGFESLKSARKLTWLPTLGQATVELEMEDRTIIEEVHTWQATIIWAFESDEETTDLRRSVVELVELLEMDEALVRSALRFWVNKLVLHEISPNTFAVLETLNQEDRARSNAQAAAAAAAGGHDDSADEAELAAKGGMVEEKMGMYWQFIQGMLTNSAKEMPLPRISMMLKMLIQDGFPYSNEELQEFLGRKVADGSLELAGGKYRLRK
ncbi:hypothetical protein QTJ16_004317 [Diplocarpon rosae]|uniref:Anaphase-promoting complex subunit 2 n=1 Tax=Diplocarpon rosae TaxID=946125 RepID=A0AAD9WC96_9HELO|nr:hypothetical protein QTJ16_004317 [Diplocarpon rosae]PBP21553.1 Cullin family protein [Diplocarpon rosae]